MKTRSTPAFATPTKVLSPEKQIIGFTFQRKTSRKGATTRVGASESDQSGLPAMNLEMFDEDDEEEESM